MTSSSTFLPRDLLISIIKIHKDNDDMDMLKTWSLVHSDYLSICRPYLYRSFDMQNHLRQKFLLDGPDHQVIAASRELFLRFYRLITCSPHLVAFVRSVHIYEPGSSDFLRYLSIKFTCEHPSFAELLRLLTNMECFGLHFSGQVAWTSLNCRVEGAMAELFERSNIKELHFSGIRRFPPSLLNQFTDSLKGLYLKDIIFSDSSATSSLAGRAHGSLFKSAVQDSEGHRSQKDLVSAPKPIYLDEAYLLSSDLRVFIADPPILRVDLSQLQNLTIDFNFETLNAVWKIIARAEKTLRHLTLSQSRHALGYKLFRARSLFDPISGHSELSQAVNISSTCATLGHLLCLSHLSIVIAFPGTTKYDVLEGSVEEWCALLETSNKDSLINKLTITVDVRFMNRTELASIFHPGSNHQATTQNTSRAFDTQGKGKEDDRGSLNLLARLDDILANRNLFPMLSAVAIDLIVPRHTIPRATSIIDGGAQSTSAGNSGKGADIKLVSRPNLHSLRSRKKARRLTFDEIETSVTLMMDGTRRRLLDENAQTALNSFEVFVCMEN